VVKAFGGMKLKVEVTNFMMETTHLTSMFRVQTFSTSATPAYKAWRKKIAKAWEQVLHENITLPTPYIKLYDKEGQLTGYKYFRNLDHEPMDTTTTSVEQNDTRVDNTLTDDSSASSRAGEKRDDSGPSAVDEETVRIQTTTDYCGHNHCQQRK